MKQIIIQQKDKQKKQNSRNCLNRDGLTWLLLYFLFSSAFLAMYQHKGRKLRNK